MPTSSSFIETPPRRSFSRRPSIITPAAMNKLLEEGYSEEYGARPMKRVVQKRIEDRLSDEILAGHVLPGELVTVDVNKEGSFSFRSEEAKASE